MRQRERAGEFGKKTVWAIDNARRAVSDGDKQRYTNLAARWAQDAYHYATLSMPVE